MDSLAEVALSTQTTGLQVWAFFLGVQGLALYALAIPITKHSQLQVIMC
jgi:hypothetical protein